MADREFYFSVDDPMQFDFEVDNPIGTVKTIFVPVAGGGGSAEDEIVYGTFTTTGDFSITISLTAAQVATYLTAGKRIILRGTIGGTSLELPFIGASTNAYLFGCGIGGSSSGTLYCVRLGRGSFPVTRYDVIAVTPDTTAMLMGAEYNTGELTLYNSNGESWDVYVTSSLATVATSGSYADLSNKPTIQTTSISLNVGSNISSYYTLEVANGDGTSQPSLRLATTDSSGKLSTSNLPVKSTVTASDTDPVNSVAVIAYAGKKVGKTTVSGTTVTQALTENTFYVFGEVTSLTVTLATPADANIVNEYHFRFTSGSTATTLSLPQTVTMPSGFAVEASKTYEISIVDNYGLVVEW